MRERCLIDLNCHMLLLNLMATLPERLILAGGHIVFFCRSGTRTDMFVTIKPT